MAIQKKTEGRDLDEYLQEVWDSLESAWDKSKFDMKQGYDSEYECDCITITSKDNEGVLAKIYVNDYEGKHPVGFDVVYRYPGDKGVGVMGSYEFQSTDMDSLGEEVFDYFDEIKQKVGESKKSEADATFKVGDFVNYNAESDGKDVYDSFIPCEVVDVKDDGTLGLCVYGSYADEEGLGENASASCCSKLDHYAGMVDANTYYTDGKFKAYKGGWEILITDKELDPKVYEFIGTMDDLSEVIDFDDYYGGENFVYDEDLRDVLGATGVDTDGVDFADMSGDLAKASGSPEESKKSEAKKIVDNGIVSFRETKHPRELRKLYKACKDRFGVCDYVSSMKEDISRYGADCQYKIEGLTEDDKPIVIEMDYYGDSGDYNYTIDISLLATAGGSSLDSIGKGGPSHNFDEALNSAMASVDKYLQELPIRNDESKKSEGLPPKKLGDRRYRSRADLLNKMKQVGATEITTRDQYDELRSKQWLHKGGYAMDINGNLVGQTYFGDKDGKWYYATTKTFQGDYLPECKKSENVTTEEDAIRKAFKSIVNHVPANVKSNFDEEFVTDNMEALLDLFNAWFVFEDGEFVTTVRVVDPDNENGECYDEDDEAYQWNACYNVTEGIIDLLGWNYGEETVKQPIQDALFYDFIETKYIDNSNESKNRKKSESLTLKQKELKDMARFGQAEDITTISDEEAKALRKKGIETVGISRGTYGMNGALLRDNEGKKYVITARSSNLFYFV